MAVKSGLQGRPEGVVLAGQRWLKVGTEEGGQSRRAACLPALRVGPQSFLADFLPLKRGK